MPFVLKQSAVFQHKAATHENPHLSRDAMFQSRNLVQIAIIHALSGLALSSLESVNNAK
jgi:hypothetical protein